jgi:predicted lipoprotein with Yx(FWY)xxD motif
MRLSTLRRRPAVAAIGLAAAAPLLAACGGTASHGATGTNASAVAHTAAAHAEIGLAHGRLGTYLTGPGGRALYLWAADGRNVSHCSGACAAVWPPLTVTGRPTAVAGVRASALGTIGHGTRRQVTYEGHPLYLYAGDRHAGTTSGEGSDGFGAKWWLVSTRGGAITGHSGAAASSATSSTASASGSGSSW